MAGLGSSEKLLRSQAASVIGTIAGLEIPRNEWDDLIPNLTTNSQPGVDTQFRIASLECLGYISDEILPEELSVQSRALIISSLTQSIEDDEKICIEAVKSLHKAISYADENFKEASQRDYIMNKLVEGLSKKNTEIKVQVL